MTATSDIATYSHRRSTTVHYDDLDAGSLVIEVYDTISGGLAYLRMAYVHSRSRESFVRSYGRHAVDLMFDDAMYYATTQECGLVSIAVETSVDGIVDVVGRVVNDGGFDVVDVSCVCRRPDGVIDVNDVRSVVEFVWFLVVGGRWCDRGMLGEVNMKEFSEEKKELLIFISSYLIDNDDDGNILRNKWTIFRELLIKVIKSENVTINKNMNTFRAMKAIDQYSRSKAWTDTQISSLAIRMHTIDTNDDCIIPRSMVYAMLSPADFCISAVIGMHTSPFESTVDYGRKLHLHQVYLTKSANRLNHCISTL